MEHVEVVIFVLCVVGYIYIYVYAFCTYGCMYVYVCIYTHTHRERESERKGDLIDRFAKAIGSCVFLNELFLRP